jgi:hypothetical protein
VTGVPAPGWYADPTGEAAERWWDGGGWTERTRAVPSPVDGPSRGPGRSPGIDAPPPRPVRPRPPRAPATTARRLTVLALAGALTIAAPVALHLAVPSAAPVVAAGAAAGAAQASDAVVDPVAIAGVLETAAGPVAGGRIEVHGGDGTLLATAVSGSDGRWRTEVERSHGEVEVSLVDGWLPENVLTAQTRVTAALGSDAPTVDFALELRDASLRERGSADGIELRFGDDGQVRASVADDAHRAAVTGVRLDDAVIELDVVATGEWVDDADSACIETPDGDRYQPIEVEELSSDEGRVASRLRFAVPPASRATFSYGCGWSGYSAVRLFELADPALASGTSAWGEPIQLTHLRVGERTTSVRYLVTQYGDDREPACLRTRAGDLLEATSSRADEVETSGWGGSRVAHVDAEFEVAGDEVVGLLVGCDGDEPAIALR